MDDPVSGTEPPGESETMTCQAYQVQLLRGRYRLLADIACQISTTESMNVSEFNSVARVLGGYEVSVSLPEAPLRRTHQILYQKHVMSHTCSDVDCMDHGFVNLNKDDQPIIECMHRMKMGIKGGGVGKGKYRTPGDNISVASSRGHSVRNVPNPSKKATQLSSRSDSSDLEEEDIDIPRLTNQLNAVHLSTYSALNENRRIGRNSDYGNPIIQVRRTRAV